MNSDWVNAVQKLRCQAVTQAGQYDGLWLAQAGPQFHISFTQPLLTDHTLCPSVKATKHGSDLYIIIGVVYFNPNMLTNSAMSAREAAAACGLDRRECMTSSCCLLIYSAGGLPSQCRIAHSSGNRIAFGQGGAAP